MDRLLRCLFILDYLDDHSSATKADIVAAAPRWMFTAAHHIDDALTELIDLGAVVTTVDYTGVTRYSAAS